MRTLIASTASIALCQVALGGSTLFALDAAANRLVTVDISTGAVSERGTINSGSGFLLDFAAVGAHLYGLIWQPGVESRLIEISTADGAVLSSVNVTVGGAPSINATEAITSTADGTLLVSLWRSGAETTSSSNSIGLLGLDGAVTGIVNFGSNADFDGLGVDPAGGIVGLNREPGPDFVELLDVSYPAGSANLILHSRFSPTFNFVDDVVVIDGDIITLDASTHRINRHDRTTGAILSFIEYPTRYSLNAGLAVVETSSPCVGDLNGDELVDATDLAVLLGAWGGSGAADLDASGSVAAPDLAILLGAWGPCS